MNVQEIMSWLSEDDWFREVVFVGEDAQGAYFFNVVDEDDNKGQVKFEAEHDKVIVSGMFSDDDKWTIVDILHPEQ